MQSTLARWKSLTAACAGLWDSPGTSARAGLAGCCCNAPCGSQGRTGLLGGRDRLRGGPQDAPLTAPTTLRAAEESERTAAAPNTATLAGVSGGAGALMTASPETNDKGRSVGTARSTYAADNDDVPQTVAQHIGQRVGAPDHIATPGSLKQRWSAVIQHTSTSEREMPVCPHGSLSVRAQVTSYVPMGRPNPMATMTPRESGNDGLEKPQSTISNQKSCDVHMH